MSKADALVDVLYYLLGTFVDMVGLDVDKLFLIVHIYNMKAGNKFDIKSAVIQKRLNLTVGFIRMKK